MADGIEAFRVNLRQRFQGIIDRRAGIAEARVRLAERRDARHGLRLTRLAGNRAFQGIGDDGEACACVGQVLRAVALAQVHSPDKRRPRRADDDTGDFPGRLSRQIDPECTPFVILDTLAMYSSYKRGTIKSKKANPCQLSQRNRARPFL